VLAVSFVPRFGFSYFLSVFVALALLAMFFIFNTYWILPVGILSLICAESLYSKNFYISFIFLALFVLAYSLFFNFNHIRIIDMSIILGFGSAFLGHDKLISYSRDNENQKGRSVSKEVPRDLVQIAGGIVIILGIVFIGMVKALFFLTIFILINSVKDKHAFKAARFLTSLERENTKLGIGASWFAIGILALVSVAHNLNFIILVVIAVTFGDSIATIVGSKLKGPKLFFNKKKSYSGFFSMFAVTAIAGFYLLGIYGIIYATVAVFAEALSTFPIDDNFSIPVFMTIAYELILYI
jgi:dolichol kinase